MNNIIYECKYFKIKVRELVMVVLVLLLLLCLKKCQNQNYSRMKYNSTVMEQKENKLSDVCAFTGENIIDLNTLLKRADLCSSKWYEDVEAYISRLEEQNNLLENEQEEDYEKVKVLQECVVDDLKELKNKQSQENINKLENSLLEYQAFYSGKCEQEGRE